MELDLLRTLVTLTEAKAEKAPVEAAPPAKAPKAEPKAVIAKDEASVAPLDDVDLSPDRLAFVYRPKFDVYSQLQQTDDMESRREVKRVYAVFGREHERGAVYGITSGSEREFKRLTKLLAVSTDGEVNLERVKRAGFTLIGRIGVKRLMKRGDFIVSLVGPTDDTAPVTFYTSKKPVKTDKE